MKENETIISGFFTKDKKAPPMALWDPYRNRWITPKSASEQDWFAAEKLIFDNLDGYRLKTK
jgi:hypothetical protein